MGINPDLLSSTVADALRQQILSWWRIDILVVTDGNVSFGSEHDPANLNETNFGMSHLMGVLDHVAAVTKAHRGADPLGAPNVLANFRFDAHDLMRYDQIWLLGHDGGSSLSTAEHDAIATFMNSGRGLFATGDHADLGAGLAASLPRVRSMRHWQAPPPPLGPSRMDTTMPDQHGVVVFENQSDDIPQNLKLKWYVWADYYLSRQVYPHPLLCSSSGPITQFPDHMHEGEVVEPTVLDAVMTVGGKSYDEYPPDPNGQRVVPEIVAWGWSGGYADPEVMTGIHIGDPGTSIQRWAGTVGAYDGKRAGVGRVVVDSTWHHFFDINLIGDNAANRPAFNDPRKALWSHGFTYSPAGQEVLAKIDQYYRNIVHWLSPGLGLPAYAALVTEMALTRHLTEVLSDRDIDPLRLGRVAWEVAIRRHPPCLVLELNRALLDSIPRLKPVPFGPWDIPDPGPDDVGPHPPISPVALAQAGLGAAILAVHELGPDGVLADDAVDQLAAAALAGAHRMLREHIDVAQRSLDMLERTALLFEG